MKIKRTKNYLRVPIVALKMVKEKTSKYSTSINRAEALIKMLKPIYENSYREKVIVVGLDNANRPSVIHVVAEGNPNQSHVFIGNVFKPLLLSNSVSFILVHNHPASTLTASEQDKRVTKKLKEASALLEIQMTDHIILNEDCTEFLSMKYHNLL